MTHLLNGSPRLFYWRILVWLFKNFGQQIVYCYLHVIFCENILKIEAYNIYIIFILMSFQYNFFLTFVNSIVMWKILVFLANIWPPLTNTILKIQSVRIGQYVDLNQTFPEKQSNTQYVMNTVVYSLDWITCPWF